TMSVFQHLKLRSHKGLKQAILTDLGQINVLCGPNGGGKTTVLECIADNSRRLIGTRFSKQDIVNISAEAESPINWPHPLHAQRFRAAVEACMPPDQVWYPENFQGLWLAISGKFVEFARGNLSGNVAAHFERALGL